MAIKARAPVLAGNFGVWGGLFSTFDCAAKNIRQKEDPWKYVPIPFEQGAFQWLKFQCYNRWIFHWRSLGRERYVVC
jgi:hypothetical protein